jgi:hypothetical protein
MKYLLCITTFDNVPDIEITYSEYRDLECAHQILSNAKDIEVKYDIVISNYLEFEKQILQNAATFMIRNITDYQSIFEIQQSLNIRMVNLLTATRLYIDQLKRNVINCFPKEPPADDIVNKFFSNEYDENKEYRFMEALRNYVQHRGMPVHMTQHGQRWTSLEGDGLLEYNLELSSDFSRLMQDSKFKKSVLNEINEKIDLKASTRSYIESISNIHESVRGFIAVPVMEARQLIENTHLRFPSKYGKNLTSLTACKQADGGKLKSLPLLLEWDNVRLELQKRNKKLINLSKRYVTGVLKVNKE